VVGRRSSDPTRELLLKEVVVVVAIRATEALLVLLVLLPLVITALPACARLAATWRSNPNIR